MAARRALLRQRGGQSATALERAQLEKRVALLGTVGSNAPFVGLLGTVIGVIRAFEELGHDAAGSAGAGGSQVASQAVMSGIAEALVATAVGIAVALPAIAAYNYFQRRVTALLAEARHCRTWCSPISPRALLQLYRGHVYRKQRRAPLPPSRSREVPRRDPLGCESLRRGAGAAGCEGARSPHHRCRLHAAASGSAPSGLGVARDRCAVH